MILKLKRHSLLYIYIIIFILLTYGVFETSGTKHFSKLAIYIITFIASYFVIHRVLERKKNITINIFPNVVKKPNIYTLIIPSIFLIISHFIHLGYIPIIRAMSLNDIDKIAWVRTNITIDSNVFFNYSSDILMKAVLPFILFFTLLKDKKTMFLILSFIFGFYAFALMQKSFIVVVFLPSLIYSIYSKKIIYIFFNSSIIFLIIMSISFITNPRLNNGSKSNINNVNINKTNPSSKTSSTNKIILGLTNRILIVPGKMITGWFENVPSKIPHSGIDGYRVVAKLKNIPPKYYDEELYPIISKEYYDRGLRGTVNVASFMYEYAYFGKYGLVLSAIVLSSILVFVDKIFYNNFIEKISLNIYPIFMLSSSALTTMMLSGGWSISILLFILFLNKKTNNEKL